VFAVAVAVVSLALIAFGLQDLIASRSPLGLVVIAVACYGVYQVARTPLALHLTPDGVLRLVALGGGAVRAADLERVQLTRTGTLRPDGFSFVRRDGSTAFTTDAGAWDVVALRDLLTSVRVRIEVPTRTPR
jgi:hypothetical protein